MHFIRSYLVPSICAKSFNRQQICTLHTAQQLINVNYKRIKFYVILHPVFTMPYTLHRLYSYIQSIHPSSHPSRLQPIIPFHLRCTYGLLCPGTIAHTYCIFTAVATANIVFRIADIVALPYAAVPNHSIAKWNDSFFFRFVLIQWLSCRGRRGLCEFANIIILNCWSLARCPLPTPTLSLSLSSNMHSSSAQSVFVCFCRLSHCFWTVWCVCVCALPNRMCYCLTSSALNAVVDFYWPFRSLLFIALRIVCWLLERMLTLLKVLNRMRMHRRSYLHFFVETKRTKLYASAFSSSSSSNFFFLLSFVYLRSSGFACVSVYTRATERLKINGLWGQRRIQNSSIRPFVRPSVNKQCWEVFGVNQVAKKFLSTWVLLFTEKEISRMLRNTYTHTSLSLSLSLSSCVQCLTYYSTRCTHTQATCVYIVQSQLYTNTCSSSIMNCRVRLRRIHFGTKTKRNCRYACACEHKTPMWATKPAKAGENFKRNEKTNS